MKKIAIIIATVLVLCSSNIKAQENPTYKYSFINEYGFFLGSGNYYTNIGLTGVFINGVTVNNKFFMGIGLGYETDDESGQSVPVFLNYRYFLPSNSTLKPFLNFAIGSRFSYWTVYDNYWMDPVQKSAFGFYSTLGGGFNKHAFSFSSGLFLKSIGDNFFGGFEVKAGFKL